jgi:hypothetical protein
MTYLIYLLSGLLVIHGIVCLLGAFFPFYPPVYLFYVFFPGHFAIRLIIILITGAAQIAYGLHLILRKRWRIRWYWPALATIVITALLLVYPAVQDPGLFSGLAGRNENYQPIPVKGMPPPQLPIQVEGKPDDIIPVPGGLVYRANSHQEGVENPWPPIDTTKVVISSSFKVDMVYIRYRDYIETKAGESRNNIVSVSMSNRAVGSPNLYTVNLPTGIEVTEGMRLHRPGPVAVVLVMDVSPNVKTGEYSFDIGIEIDGKDYGTIPCTIEVTGITTLNNRGITGITIQPEPSQYLVYDNQGSAGVILKSVTIKSDVCDRDYMDLRGHSTVRKSEPCLLVTGQVESQLGQDKYMTLSARGYDVNGEEVTYVLDHGPIWGVISIFVPAKGVNEFVLHLKTAPDVVKIELMPSPELYDIPPP